MKVCFNRYMFLVFFAALFYQNIKTLSGARAFARYFRSRVISNDSFEDILKNHPSFH